MTMPQAVYRQPLIDRRLGLALIALPTVAVHRTDTLPLSRVLLDPIPLALPLDAVNRSQPLGFDGVAGDDVGVIF